MNENDLSQSVHVRSVGAYAEYVCKRNPGLKMTAFLLLARGAIQWGAAEDALGREQVVGRRHNDNRDRTLRESSYRIFTSARTDGRGG